jgi:hypothetical protein
VLLSVLAEVYTFINPESYNFLWREYESWLSTMRVLLEEAIRFVIKASKFWLSVDFAMLIFGITWHMAEIDSPQEWGVVVCLIGLNEVIAFRCAIPLNCWVARWFIWTLDFLDRFVELW